MPARPLNPTQMRILVWLGAKGEKTIHEICEELFYHHDSVQRTLSGLRAQGKVIRRQGDDNRRMYLYRLSDELYQALQQQLLSVPEERLLE